jgi:outer membrane protein assembly factor BamB
MIRPSVLSFLAACVFLSRLSEGAEFDWPNWRGPDHNGVSKETGWLSTWPAEGPKQLWKTSVGAGFSSIVVANGRAYTMGNRDNTDIVYALDAESGRVLWRHSYPADLEAYLYEGGPNATPTVEGKVLYTVGRRGQLFCLDTESGKEIWSKNLVKEFALNEPPRDWWGITGSPLVEGELLIINAGTFGVAVAKKSGKPVWSSGKEPCAYASPVLFESNGQRTVAIFGGKAVAALDPKTGKELWQFQWKTSWDINAADPIVADGQMFVSSGYGTGGALLKLGAGAPTLVWKSKDLHNQMNPSVLIGDHLYGVSGQERVSAELRCVEFRTGKVRWSERFSTMGSLMAADGRLIALNEKGELLVARAVPDSFQQLARAQVLGGKCWTVPILSNGRIYCRNARGDLVCLDVRAKAVAEARR